MDKHKRLLINKGLICPYCFSESIYTDSAEFYNGKSYGMVYACRPCKAWVGIIPGSPRIALGRLANHELRLAKRSAKHYFELIWKNRHMTKARAQSWVAAKLKIAKRDCYIGKLDLNQCNKVIELSRKFLSV